VRPGRARPHQHEHLTSDPFDLAVSDPDTGEHLGTLRTQLRICACGHQAFVIAHDAAHHAAHRQPPGAVEP
jgi:hypothetical protein